MPMIVMRKKGQKKKSIDSNNDDENDEDDGGDDKYDDDDEYQDGAHYGNNSNDYNGSHNNNSNNGLSSRKNKSTNRPSYVGREVYDPKKYEVKKELKPLQTDRNAVKWWDRIGELSEERRWVTLDHNGVVFAPAYQPHCVKMKYENRDVELTPDQEEIATMYAMMIETDWVKKR